MQSFNMLGQHPLVTKQSHVPKCSRLSFKNQSTVLGQPLAAGISCQPSQRKTSSSGRAIIRTVRATIAEPSSKDAVNTWSRGGHWQVRITILGCLCTIHPSHELSEVRLQILYIYMNSTPINLLYTVLNTGTQIWWHLRCECRAH